MRRDLAERQYIKDSAGRRFATAVYPAIAADRDAAKRNGAVRSKE
ncbi:MAG TPA: hypothetical protein VM120_15405 [Bryobacteraceae bacterium]|nr:hypothetical protein [Bryobacteraceae bacterium]